MISFSAVTKRYPEGLEALRGVSFSISAGEMVFFTGHSGAGKSTVFRLLAAIERPTSGSIVVNGQNLAALRKSAIPYLRRNFGLIFQDQKLLFDRSVLDNVLLPLEKPLDAARHRPFIIMIAGVNGAGKTTSIGKLAKYFQAQGKSVLLAAGDTFRAAAREQLMAWGERNNVTVISQESGDPAAVIFDAISAARARGIDIVLADTAGRLPTQLHLMEEIAKVRRVIQKADPTGPHETLLVLDANFGQNALMQVKAFDKSINVTGLIVTKLDGSAKGGVVAAIARQCPKPIRFIGVGESIDDLRPFVARDFVEALFE